MDSDRLTEYDRQLGSKSTDNEWLVKQLARLGILPEQFDSNDIEPGFFGTFSEVKPLEKITQDKGIQNLLLVCSAYHSLRVWVTFSALLKNSRVKIVIHGVYEAVGLRRLLV